MTFTGGLWVSVRAARFPHNRAAERGIELFAQATDGGQALDAVARVCPDGILLDINLPGPDGFTDRPSRVDIAREALRQGASP